MNTKGGEVFTFFSPPFGFTVHSFTVITLKILPSLKSEIFPPLWESTIPTAGVSRVIPATEACRVPRPFGIEARLVSMVMYRPAASMIPSPEMTKAPSIWESSLTVSRISLLVTFLPNRG